MSIKSLYSFKSLNVAWFLANAMETVKRRSRAKRKSMFTSQKDTNTERETSSKLELFSASFESNYAVALGLRFVCFWTKKKNQLNKTNKKKNKIKNETCASF